MVERVKKIFFEGEFYFVLIRQPRFTPGRSGVASFQVDRVKMSGAERDNYNIDKKYKR